jgi:hypothetical protein
MTGKSKRFSNDDIAIAITDSHGILSVSAKKLDCSRQTIYNHLKKSKRLQALYNNENETMIDFVEMKLFENIQAGKEASIFFFLKTKAKHRGYIERPVWSDYKIDLTKRTNYQLERFAKGEDLIYIFCHKVGREKKWRSSPI